MTKKTSIILLCLFTVLVLFFGVFAFIPDGLPFGEYNEFYSPYTLVQKSAMFGDTVKATYQIKLDEGVNGFDSVQKVLKSRLARVYGYYSVDITEDKGVVTINLPQTANAENASANSILSAITQQGKLEILSAEYSSSSNPTYSEDLVVLSQDNLRAPTVRSVVNGEYTYNICTVKPTKEGAELVKKAKLTDSTMYYYAIDGQITYVVNYRNGQFEIYGTSKDNCKLLSSIVKNGSLGATLTQIETEEIENNLDWLFVAIMGVIILGTFVFFAVRYKTLGIAGILSQLIAIVLFMYAIGLIHLSTFNLFAAIATVLAYAFMTFFTIFVFERIRAKSQEKTFATAAYHGFFSTNIVSLIAHAALLVLGIILWVIPTAVTAPMGTVFVYGAILSFVATFGLNRLFVKFVEPFNEVSGKTVAKK